MPKIVFRETLAPKTHRFRVEAPLIARKRKAGQFVILFVEDSAERLPLTIVDSDPEAGTIDLVFQEVGKSTLRLAEMQVGDEIREIAGPLGKPTHIEKRGACVVLGGGYGVAPVIPIAKALADAGNDVIGINGARSKDLVILEKELRDICSEVIICTDDGTYGRPGFVTQALEEIYNSGRKIDFVLAVGPAPMMRAVANMTREWGIPTMVSLNPIMIDGTGMCGGCRVEVGGKTKFACVDGPEFDGHLVDFDLLMARQKYYAGQESEARKMYEEHLACKLDEAGDGR